METNVTFFHRSGEKEYLPITLGRGLDVEIFGARNGEVSLEVHALSAVPNSVYDPEATSGIQSRATFPDGISLEEVTVTDDRDVALSIVAARATSEFHEELEWVRFEGNLLADPHPENEGEAWSWLYGRMKEMAVEYAERFPTHQTPEPLPPTT